MSEPALIVVDVDVQQGFRDRTHWGPRNNPGAETETLLAHWRSSG